MGNPVTTILEAPFELSGTYQVSLNSSTKTVNTGDVWYRMALARSSATGAVTNPKSFYSVFGSAMGGGISVSVSTTGYTTITWTGGGTATLNWTGTNATILRDLLGYTGNLSIANNATATSTYPTAYRMLITGRVNDTHWQAEPIGAAYAEGEDSVVSGVSSGTFLQRRRMAFKHHPIDPSAQSTLGFYATPTRPNLTGANVSQLLTPTTLPPTASPLMPWTVLQQFHVSRAMLLGASFGDFQRLLTGSVLTFDEVYLDKDTCEKGPFLNLTDPKWGMACDPGPWGFLLKNAGVSLT